jgi:hypothetical protein
VVIGVVISVEKEAEDGATAEETGGVTNGEIHSLVGAEGDSNIRFLAAGEDTPGETGADATSEKPGVASGAASGAASGGTASGAVSGACMRAMDAGEGDSVRAGAAGACTTGACLSPGRQGREPEAEPSSTGTQSETAG